MIISVQWKFLVGDTKTIQVNQIYDTKRTEWLMAHKFKVLRFWNHDVFQQTSSVIEVIMTALL